MNRHPFDALNITILILWVTFCLYWVVSAVGVKKDVPEKGNRTRWALSRFGLILVLILVFKLRVFSLLRSFAYGPAFFRNETVRITGVALAALGLAFAVWARRHLGRNWSVRPMMKIGHELVTSGPYRVVRHPIYTGMLMGWLGFGLVNGLFFMSMFLVVALIFIRRIRIEEVYMMELFPDQYPQYRATTKALIPGVW